MNIKDALNKLDKQEALEERLNLLCEDDLQEKIVKKGSKWQVQSKKGKNLGTYDTKEKAKKRLKQVEYFKHVNEELSKQQEAFFKDSEIRDNKGNLMKCYHGTDATFNRFDRNKIGSGNGGYNFGKGFYFSLTPDIAKEYSKNVKEYYLNITNVFDYYNPDKEFIYKLADVSGLEIDKDFVEGEEFEEYLYGDLIDELLPNCFKDNYVNYYSNLSDWLEKLGYDGIWAGEEIIAFYPEQIKLISNTNPTSSENVDESLSSFGNELIHITPKDNLKSIKSNGLKNFYFASKYCDLADMIDMVNSNYDYKYNKNDFMVIEFPMSALDKNKIEVDDENDEYGYYNGTLNSNNFTKVYQYGRINESKEKSTIIYRGVSDDTYSRRYKPYAGLFFTDSFENAADYGDVDKYIIKDNAKIFSYENSDAFVFDNGYDKKEYPELETSFGVKSLDQVVNLPMDDRDKYSKITRNNYYLLWEFVAQYIARIELEKQGYDGVHWLENEDWSSGSQYQIWNKKCISYLVESLNEAKEKPVPTKEDILKYKDMELPYYVWDKTDRLTDRCFICDNGKYIDTKGKRHCDIEWELQDYIAEKYNLTQWFRDNESYSRHDHPLTQYLFNWVRVNGDNEKCIVLPPFRLTKPQLDSLYDWLENYYHWNDEITVSTSDYQDKKYDLMEYDVDDIMAKINRYYNSGTLLEEFPDEEHREEHFGKHVVDDDDNEFSHDFINNSIDYEKFADKLAGTPVSTEDVDKADIVGFIQDDGTYVKYDKNNLALVKYKPVNWLPSGHKIITMYKSTPLRYKHLVLKKFGRNI